MFEEVCFLSFCCILGVEAQKLNSEQNDNLFATPKTPKQLSSKCHWGTPTIQIPTCQRKKPSLFPSQCSMPDSAMLTWSRHCMCGPWSPEYQSIHMLVIYAHHSSFAVCIYCGSHVRIAHTSTIFIMWALGMWLHKWIRTTRREKLALPGCTHLVWHTHQFTTHFLAFPLLICLLQAW